MFPRTFLFMLACAAIGYLLGRSRGMPLQGLFMGLAFGPLGWALILLWPASWSQPAASRPGSRMRPEHRPFGGAPPGAGPRSESRSESRASRPEGASQGDGRGCPRCARPIDSQAGACPHCGNVLVPVTYRVN